jgi:ubiquinone/menaquinone biosynthesis C-methylase UbiE
MKLIFLLVLISLTAVAQSSDPWKDVYKESAWTDRDKWQKSNELIRYLQIQSGSQVADVGCHEGYMSFKLASAVGNKGKVYSVDVKQEKLDKLNEHAKARQVENIITVKGDYDNPKLPINTLDAVIIIDTYHEMDDHDKILVHVMNALKPGGRLILCEPIAKERREASREDQEGRHELGMNYALNDLKMAGFVIIKEQDPFINRTEKGDVMWLIVAGKSSLPK